MQKQDKISSQWNNMSKSEKIVGAVAMAVFFGIVVWFLVGASKTEAPTINDKIEQNSNSVIEESQPN